jgi:predicted HTH transcriptional regulator
MLIYYISVVIVVTNRIDLVNRAIPKENSALKKEHVVGNFMSTAELSIILQQGEGYNVEFKQAISEEICAFANAAGGTMLIGVRDDNTVCGVQTDNTTRSRIIHSLRVIDPTLEVGYEETVYKGNKLIALTCKTGKKKPYTVSGSIFIRIGDKNLSILRQLHLIEREGPDRGGKWRIVIEKNGIN